MTSLKNLQANLTEIKMDVLSNSELSNLKGGCGGYYGGGKSGKNKSGKNNYGGGKSGKNNYGGGYGGGYGGCCSCYCHG